MTEQINMINRLVPENRLVGPIETDSSPDLGLQQRRISVVLKRAGVLCDKGFLIKAPIWVFVLPQEDRGVIW